MKREKNNKIDSVTFTICVWGFVGGGRRGTKTKLPDKIGGMPGGVRGWQGKILQLISLPVETAASGSRIA